MGNFENTLKQIIWKPLQPKENFETHNLKTIETYGDFWKHFERHNFENHWKLWGNLKTPHWAMVTQVWPLKPWVFNWHSNETLMCSHAWRENLLFSRCWKYRLYYYRLKQQLEISLLAITKLSTPFKCHSKTWLWLHPIFSFHD